MKHTTCRNIEIDGVNYTWKVGKHYVNIRRLNNRGKPVSGCNPSLIELCAGYWSWDNIEESKYKGGGFAIRPKLIELYIRKTILHESVEIEFQDTIIDSV